MRMGRSSCFLVAIPLAWVALLPWTPTAAATADDFADHLAAPHFSWETSEGLKLVLKGQARLSLRNIEGRGGPGFDSITDTRTIGTRSPTAGLDDATLATRLSLPDAWRWHLQLRFTDTKAWVDASWVDWSTGDDATGATLELGHHHPLVAMAERSSRESLASRVYWGSSEEHLTGAVHHTIGDISLTWAQSLAMMRPLGAAPVNDGGDTLGTLAVLSYSKAEPHSGNRPVAGGMLSLTAPHVSASGFGFIGQLAEERGVSELSNRIANYTRLPGDDGSTQFHWFGGRAQAEFKSSRATAETIQSQEGLLSRRLIWGELRGIQGLKRHRLEPWARLERLTLLNGQAEIGETETLRNSATSQAITWDWQVLTLGMAIYGPGDWVALQLEHSFIGEPEGEPFSNDESTLQLELRF
jgi:hypothetical protein